MMNEETQALDVRYPAKIEKQEPDGFFVQFLNLEDGFTEGATIEEALFNASELAVQSVWPFPETLQNRLLASHCDILQ